MNTPFLHASASQVTTFQRCQRRWHFQSIQRIQTPSTGPQLLGQEIHKQLENYTLRGDLPSHGSAKLALQYLPPPGVPEVFAERELDRPDLYLGGVRFKGFIDVLDARDELHVGILDFKTTSDFRYAKSEAELARNPQLLIYAAWALECVPEIEDFKLSHIYLKTKNGHGARLVETKVPAADVMPSLESVVQSVGEMKVAALAERAEDLPANWDACHDFGGCPFRDRCNATRSLSSMFANETAAPSQGAPSMSALLNKLKAATNKPAPAATGILPPDAPKYPTATTPAPSPGATSTTLPEINFYIVWNPDSDKPPQKRFVNLKDAQDAASQMSAKNPGKSFFVCFAMAVSK